MTPFMAPTEWAQVQAAIIGAAPETILEWGSGGSTLELARMAKRVVSVEHDAAWYHQVQARLSAEHAAQHWLIPPSEPEVVSWEWRKRAEFEREIFANYIDHPRLLGVRPDVVIVDGRARRFCILEGLALLQPGGLLILHDAQRRIYRDVIPAHAVFLDGWSQGQVSLVRKQ